MKKQSHLASNLTFRDDVWDLELVYLTDIDIFNELKFITSGRKTTQKFNKLNMFRIPSDMFLWQVRHESNHLSSFLFPVLLQHIEKDSKDRD